MWTCAVADGGATSSAPGGGTSESVVQPAAPSRTASGANRTRASFIVPHSSHSTRSPGGSSVRPPDQGPAPLTTADALPHHRSCGRAGDHRRVHPAPRSVHRGREARRPIGRTLPEPTAILDPPDRSTLEEVDDWFP